MTKKFFSYFLIVLERYICFKWIFSKIIKIIFSQIDNISLDPEPNWAKILDPDPNSMYLVPQHYFSLSSLFWQIFNYFCLSQNVDPCWYGSTSLVKCSFNFGQIHWETRIKELGGKAYSSKGARMLDR